MADGTSVAGTWAYRSYINTSDQPIFGAGLFTFQNSHCHDPDRDVRHGLRYAA